MLGEVLKHIEQRSRFLLTSHARADGDAVGSTLACYEILRQMGKSSDVMLHDGVPRVYQQLPFAGKVVQADRVNGSYDAAILLECDSIQRARLQGLEGQFLINIDHHASNTRYGHLNWVSPREPSSGELIFRLLKVARWPITKQIADCLFTAVSTDTGSFQYPTTRPGTFHVGAELVTLGANLAKICDEVYQSYPLSRVRLLKHVYNHFRLTHDDQIAWFWLKKADFARTGADTSDSEGLIDHIRAIEPVVVACVFE